jgi:hypothetical protein
MGGFIDEKLLRTGHLISSRWAAVAHRLHEPAVGDPANRDLFVA